MEDGPAGAAAAGDPTKNGPREQENEPHGKQKKNGPRRQQLLPMLSRRKRQPGSRTVGAAHSRTLGGGRDGLAGLDGSVDCLGCARRL